MSLGFIARLCLSKLVFLKNSGTQKRNLGGAGVVGQECCPVTVFPEAQQAGQSPSALQGMVGNESGQDSLSRVPTSFLVQHPPFAPLQVSAKPSIPGPQPWGCPSLPRDLDPHLLPGDSISTRTRPVYGSEATGE